MKKAMLFIVMVLSIVLCMVIHASINNQTDGRGGIAVNTPITTQTAQTAIASSHLNSVNKTLSIDIVNSTSDRQIESLVNTDPSELLASAAIYLAAYQSVTTQNKKMPVNPDDIRVMALQNLNLLMRDDPGTDPAVLEGYYNEGLAAGASWYSDVLVYGQYDTRTTTVAKTICDRNGWIISYYNQTPTAYVYSGGYKKGVSDASFNQFNW